MSRGKYSLVFHLYDEKREFKYNCFGQEPECGVQSVFDPTVPYNEQTMSDGYDSEGYDSYGYSAFDSEGNYVGNGRGVDKAGWTEYQYLNMDDLSSYERRTLAMIEYSILH